jgi:hypothetical protein
MRIRITQPLKGSIDGIQLDGFVPGSLYVVGPTLGCYLLALGAAEPVIDDTPALITPLDQQMGRQPRELKGSPSFPRIVGQAADRRRTRRKRENEPEGAA